MVQWKLNVYLVLGVGVLEKTDGAQANLKKYLVMLVKTAAMWNFTSKKSDIFHSCSQLFVLGLGTLNLIQQRSVLF
jgi:hypothetical protein